MIAMMLDIKGDTDQIRKAYHATNDALKSQVDFDGLVFHTAGPTPGGFRILDVWKSRTQFEKFAQTMVAIAQKNGMTGVAPEIWEIENSMNIPAG